MTCEDVRCGGVRERARDSERYGAAKAAMATLLMTAVIVSAAPAALAGVAAGAVISNTAHVRYKLDGVIHDVDTNVVETRVDEIVAFEIADAGSDDISSSTSDDNVLAFTVRNAGNGCESIVPSASASEGATMEIAAIVIDANGDGAMQSGVDTVYDGGPGPRLCPDESVDVFVVVRRIAPGRPGRGYISLVVSGAFGTGARGSILPHAGDAGGDVVIGADMLHRSWPTFEADAATHVSLVKSQTVLRAPSSVNVQEGDVVTYALRVAATGTGLIEDAVLSDPLPAGLAYIAGTLALDGLTLSDDLDADDGSVAGGAVIVRLPAAPAPFDHIVTFNARVLAP